VPQTPDEQVRLADAWWTLSEQTGGVERDSLMLHAAEWYAKARPGLPEGFARAKVEKRLAEADKIERPGAAGGGGTGSASGTRAEGGTGKQVEPLAFDLDKGGTRAVLPEDAGAPSATLRLEVLGLEGGFPEPTFVPGKTVEAGGKTNLRFSPKEFPEFWLEVDFDAKTRPTVSVVPMIDYGLPSLPSPRRFAAKEASQVAQSLVMEQQQLEAVLQKTPAADSRKKDEINGKIGAIKEMLDKLKRLNGIYTSTRGQRGKVHFRVFAVVNGREVTLVQSGNRRER
jgi:hypothetical protein